MRIHVLIDGQVVDEGRGSQEQLMMDKSFTRNEENSEI